MPRTLEIGKHDKSTWTNTEEKGWVLVDYTINSAPIKTIEYSVPWSNSSYNFSEVYGKNFYDYRTIECTFACYSERNKQHSSYYSFEWWLRGGDERHKGLYLRFSDMATYGYKAYFESSSYSSSESSRVSYITVTFKAEPNRYLL